MKHSEVRKIAKKGFGEDPPRMNHKQIEKATTHEEIMKFFNEHELKCQEWRTARLKHFIEYKKRMPTMTEYDLWLKLHQAEEALGKNESLSQISDDLSSIREGIMSLVGIMRKR